MIPSALDCICAYLRPIDLRILANAFSPRLHLPLAQQVWWHLLSRSEPLLKPSIQEPLTSLRSQYFDNIDNFCEVCGTNYYKALETQPVTPPDLINANENQDHPEGDPPEGVERPEGIDPPEEPVPPAPLPLVPLEPANSDDLQSVETTFSCKLRAYGATLGLCEACKEHIDVIAEEDRNLLRNFDETLRVLRADENLKFGLFHLTRLERLCQSAKASEFLVFKTQLQQFRDEFFTVNERLTLVERTVAFPRRMGELFGSRFRENFVIPLLKHISTFDGSSRERQSDEARQAEREEQADAAVSAMARQIGRRRRRAARLMKSADSTTRDFEWIMSALSVLSAALVQDVGVQWTQERLFLPCWKLSKVMQTRLSQLRSVLSHPHVLPLATSIFNLIRADLLRDLGTLSTDEKTQIWKALMWGFEHLEDVAGYTQIENVALSAARQYLPADLRLKVTLTTSEAASQRRKAMEEEQAKNAPPVDEYAYKRLRRGETLEEASKRARMETQATLAQLQALMASGTLVLD